MYKYSVINNSVKSCCMVSYYEVVSLSFYLFIYLLLLLLLLFNGMGIVDLNPKYFFHANTS